MGTFNAAVIPASTGLTLGTNSQRWDAYIQNLYLSNPFNATAAINASTLNGVVFADQQAGADAAAKINTAIGLLPSTGGVVDARGFQGIQVCNTNLLLNKTCTVLLGACTLQFTGSVASPAVNISAAGSCLVGVGPVANTTGSSVIQALSGFTGILVQLGTVAGDTNQALRFVKIDANSIAGVTACLKITSSINWTVMDEIALDNCTAGAGLLIDTAVQEIRCNRLFSRNCATGIDASAGSGGAAAGGWYFSDPRILANGYGAILGSDDAISANTISNIVFRGGEVAITSLGDGSKPVILERNVRNVVLDNTWLEYSSVASGVTNYLVQLGTATPSTPSGSKVVNCYLIGNNNANFGVGIINAGAPLITGNTPITLNSRLVSVVGANTQAWISQPGSSGGGLSGSPVDSITGTAFVFGGSPQFLRTPWVYSNPAAGVNALTIQEDADAQVRIALQSHGVIRLGPGGGTGSDVGLSRSAVNTLALGNGAALDVSGTLALSQENIVTANGGQWQLVQNSENLTLSIAGTTTDTVGNLLPANSIIESVVARVTTTITTATDWKLGDSVQAARFSSPNATMTAGTTQVGLNQADPTVASANLGPVQTSAAKVRVTTTGTPGAGAIRITVFARTYIPPTS